MPAAAVLYRGQRMADIRRDFGMHIVDDAVTIAWAMAAFIASRNIRVFYSAPCVFLGINYLRLSFCALRLLLHVPCLPAQKFAGHMFFVIRFLKSGDLVMRKRLKISCHGMQGLGSAELWLIAWN
jgi:hypothetical protein